MPIKKAAFKHLRQTKVRTVRNQAIKKNLQRILKETRRSLDAGEAEKAREHLRQAIHAIDKAVQHGVWKQNTGARKKSRLTKRLNALGKKGA